MRRTALYVLAALLLAGCSGNDSSVADDVAEKLERVGTRRAECKKLDFRDGSELCVSIHTGEEAKGHCFELSRANILTGTDDVPPNLELHLDRIDCGP